MTKVTNIVRGALQARAVTVTNLPPAQHRVFEGYLPNGQVYRPTVGTPYVSFQMGSVSVDKPLLESLYRHDGIFQISLFYPKDGRGTRGLEDLADDVRAKFPLGLRISTDENRVLIRNSSRAPILEEAEWLQIPITIAWRYYSPQA